MWCAAAFYSLKLPNHNVIETEWKCMDSSTASYKYIACWCLIANLILWCQQTHSLLIRNLFSACTLFMICSLEILCKINEHFIINQNPLICLIKWRPTFIWSQIKFSLKCNKLKGLILSQMEQVHNDWHLLILNYQKWCVHILVQWIVKN